MAQAESALYRLLRKQSLAFLAAALFASVCLVLVGALVESTQPIYARLLFTVGSSGLGTCLGLVFGSLTGSSALHRIKELVEQTLNSNLNAVEDELQEFRKVWHHYLVTRIEGKLVWRYRTIDFSKTIVPGKLVATLSVVGPAGGTHTYTIEAFISAPRVIFIQKAIAGTEVPVVHVYPYATEVFRSVICGVAFLQSWDGENLGVPALMSTSQLGLGLARVAEGTLPESAFARLDEMWVKCAGPLGLLVSGRA